MDEEIDDAPERRTWVVDRTGVRADRGLADQFPDLSRARIQALIAEGQVEVDGRPMKGSEKLPIGAEVTIQIPAVRDIGIVPEDLPLRILHLDEDVVVIAKAAGMVVHPSPGHETGTLVHALLFHVPTLSGIGGESRPGIVHRLDVGTSGVMVVARNDVAHRALSEQFKAHSVDRRYVAMVHRTPRYDQGTERSFIARDPENRLRMASGPEGREAITDWRVVDRGDRVAVVECRLRTGRTHQVRVHLSELGHPIVGDRMYARRECVAPALLRADAEALGHPLLHAWHLGFAHPRTGAWMAFAEPPPADFVSLVALAGMKLPNMVPQPR
jgi:23S rRNA pseudouridine1911/1915/1917 synthase